MAIIMMSSVLVGVLISSEVVASWSTDFDTDDGWEITGGQFTVTGGQLVFTNLDRTGTDIASHEFTESEATDYNITFEIAITDLSGEDGDMIFFVVSGPETTSTTSPLPDDITYWQIYTGAAALKACIRSKEDVVANGNQEYTLSEDHTYSIRTFRWNDSGTWKINGTLWDEGSSFESPLYTEEMSLTGSPLTMNYSCFQNYNTGVGYPIGGWIDNYTDDFGGSPPSGDAMEITTVPNIVAFAAHEYTYNVRHVRPDIKRHIP